MKIRHSGAYPFLIFLLGIILIGFTVSVLMKPIGDMYSATYNKSEVQDDSYQQFYTRTTTIWIWLPVVLGLGLLFWVLAKSHERENL